MLHNCNSVHKKSFSFNFKIIYIKYIVLQLYNTIKVLKHGENEREISDDGSMHILFCWRNNFYLLITITRETGDKWFCLAGIFCNPFSLYALPHKENCKTRWFSSIPILSSFCNSQNRFRKLLSLIERR